MKKQLLLIFTLFLGFFAADAQITITMADVAVPPKVLYQSNDTLPTVSVGSAGILQTWNMSGLNSHTVDTLAFIPYGWMPDATFPTSNMAVKQGWQNNYVYLTNNASALTIEGSAGTVDFGSGPTPVKQINSPSEILMNFPATYLTAYTNNFTQSSTVYFGFDPGIGFQIDTVKQRSIQKKTVLVDAWGTLTTPLSGTAFNVIRVKETVVRHDTTDAQVEFIAGFPMWQYNVQVSADSTTGYTWRANGVGFPLVSIKLDSLGALKQVQWLQALPVVGINEAVAKENAINVFPNPAQNEINFGVDASKVETILVYDITGKLKKSFAVTANNAVINTSEFANGEYSYSVLGKDKSILNQGKFTIVK